MSATDSTSSDPYVLKIITELYCNISAVNIYVSSHPSCTQMNVVLHPLSLTVSQYSDGKLIHETKLQTPKPFFSPTSFCNISGPYVGMKALPEGSVRVMYSKVNDSKNANCTMECSVTFRLQVVPDNAIVFERDDLSSLEYAGHLDLTVVRCRSCDSALHEGYVTFDGTSWLPSNQDDMAENFFCHPSGQQPELRREDGDHVLRATVTCFYLTCLDQNHLTKDYEKKVYRCKKCNTILSKRSELALSEPEPVIGCFKDKVWFSDRVRYRKPDLQHLASLIIREMADDSWRTSVACKLYLDCEFGVSSEKSCLLIWVFDKNLKRSLVTQSFDDAGEEELQFECVMKVFYQVASPDSELARQWRYTFAVDYFRISDTMYNSMVELLNKNTFTLQDVSATPGFSVSYLQFS